jgi:DNA-binding MarR family transcriptional regulator
VTPGDSQRSEAVRLADEFGRTAKLLGTQLADRLAGHGMSIPRFNVLVALMRHGPLRVTELREQIGITQGTASTLAEALVAEGLIERQADPADRRANRLRLTETGRARAEAWIDDYAAVAEELFGVLSTRQKADLFSTLRGLAAPHI